MAGEFLSEQELRGRSVQGLNDLRRGVKRYLVWLEAQGLRPEYISLNNAREYQAYLVERGLCPNDNPRRALCGTGVPRLFEAQRAEP